MKGAITGFIVCLIMVFSVYIMQATTATSVRQDELTTNTSNAVDATIQSCRNNKYSTDDALKVEITECDHTKGILSVKVVETYKIPNGKTRTVSCEKTGVVEE